MALLGSASALDAVATTATASVATSAAATASVDATPDSGCLAPTASVDAAASIDAPTVSVVVVKT
jgi:hypothetical protein